MTDEVLCRRACSWVDAQNLYHPSGWAPVWPMTIDEGRCAAVRNHAPPTDFGDVSYDVANWVAAVNKRKRM